MRIPHSSGPFHTRDLHSRLPAVAAPRPGRRANGKENTAVSKLKVLRGYLSWIVFALFPNSEVAWAALAGLAVALVLFVLDRRAGIPFDALVLDVSTLFFFAALSITAFAAPHASLGTWSGALSFGWLAITAWGSLALRQPFTLGMARQRVTREISEQPAFMRSQTALTRLWAVVFTATTALLVLCDAAHQGTVLSLAVRVAGLGTGAYLTSRHIKASRQRMAASAATVETS